MASGAVWSLQSPSGVPGAVGVVRLRAASASDIDSALARLGLPSVQPGTVSLRRLAGVDDGLVARFDDGTVYLFPHGGPATIRQLAAAMSAAGLSQDPAPDEVWPEAEGDIEARMLAALSRAASPAAIDLLLEQPRRWAGRDLSGSRTDAEATRDRILHRLIDPPLVVAIGPPNVGKSSLANALAGRNVAIVADQPGTTRDHVGITLDLAGLVVRYIDAPGFRAGAGDPIEEDAVRLAAEVAGQADLVLVCSDIHSGPLPCFGDIRDRLDVALRVDLGIPSWPFDAAVSVATGTGVASLVSLIRDRLVPPGIINADMPWKFWL